MKSERMDRAKFVAFTSSGSSILNLVPAVSFGEWVPQEPLKGRVYADFQRVGADLHQAFDKLGTELANEPQAQESPA